MEVQIKDGCCTTYIACDSVVQALEIIRTHAEVRTGNFRTITIVNEE